MRVEFIFTMLSCRQHNDFQFHLLHADNINTTIIIVFLSFCKDVQ